MKKRLFTLAFLPVLLLSVLLSVGVVPAAATAGSGPGPIVTQGHYRNPPRRGNPLAPKGPQVAQLQTIPPTPGVTFQIAGQQFVTGADGSVVVLVPQPGTYDLQVITDTYHDPYRRVEFSRWLSESFQPTRQIHLPTSTPVVQVGLDVFELVGQKFVGPDGAPVPLQRIASFSMRSLQGDAFTLHDGQPRWIPASRVTRRRDGGLDVVPLLYTITSVMVDGSNVVNKAQQQFYAKPNGTWTITLLFYSIRVHAADALFGFPVGKAVNLELPNGHVQVIPLDSTGTASASSLARGEYYFQVTGAKGFSPRSPVALSKDQDLNAKVITFLDMGAVFAVGLLVAIGLLVFGKLSLRRAEARHDAERRMRVLPTE